MSDNTYIQITQRHLLSWVVTRNDADEGYPLSSYQAREFEQLHDAIEYANSLTDPPPEYGLRIDMHKEGECLECSPGKCRLCWGEGTIPCPECQMPKPDGREDRIRS